MTRFATRAVHAGRENLANAHVPPIDLSTTNPVPDLVAGAASYDALAGGGRPGPGGAVYQRLWNPTVARFEDALAALEGTDEAVAFASGMAAMAACVLALDGKSHVVAVRPLYGGTDHLLANGLLGSEVTYASPDTITESLRATTGLVVLETPANPTLELVDIAQVVEAARGVPVLVDNTFATPVLQRPREHGASLVLHSATKYLGGHGDVIGGVVAATTEWAERLRRVRAVTGGLLHPLAAYLLHRGLQTLPVRVRAQQESASALVEWLRTHPLVEEVHYPHGPLIGTQMSGPGAIVTFTVVGGLQGAARTVEHVRLITHAVSLGGVDTLVQHPASLTHRPVEAAFRPAPGVLRMSVGLEDVRDLRADLDTSLREAHV